MNPTTPNVRTTVPYTTTTLPNTDKADLDRSSGGLSQRTVRQEDRPLEQLKQNLAFARELNRAMFDEDSSDDDSFDLSPADVALYEQMCATALQPGFKKSTIRVKIPADKSTAEWTITVTTKRKGLLAYFKSLVKAS